MDIAQFLADSAKAGLSGGPVTRAQSSSSESDADRPRLGSKCHDRLAYGFKIVIHTHVQMFTCTAQYGTNTYHIYENIAKFSVL
jgi:hypothetical protein